MSYLRVIERVGLLGVLLLSIGGTVAAEEPSKTSVAKKPPWQRYLQGEDAKKAAQLAKQVNERQQAGKFADALKAIEALAELRQKVQGADHWQAIEARSVAEQLRRVSRQGEEGQKEYSRAFDLQRRAVELLNKGRYREAQPLLEKVLAICRKVLGEERPDTGNSYNNVAYCLAMQGKYAEAEEGYRKALMIRRKTLGEMHPATAQSYGNLAFNLHEQGQYVQAEKGLRRALDLRRRLLGEEHDETAQSYNNLALNLSAQGRFGAAEEFLRKSLAIRRKVLGEEHSSTAIAYDNLAINLAERGRYAEAEKGFRKSLAIFLKVVGEAHPSTAQCYFNLAGSLHAQGKYTEAGEFYRTSLAVRRKVLGEEHPDTAQSYSGLAGNLNARAKYARAEELYRKALAIRRKVLGEEHPDTAASHDGLAGNLEDQGKYAEAESGFRVSLAIRRKVLGENHLFTATAYGNLATHLSKQGAYAEAEELYRKALVVRLKLLGAEHPDTAVNYVNLSKNLADQGKYAQAEEGLRKALNILRKRLGEEHPDTAFGYASLAGSLKLQGKYAEAEEGFRKALTIRRKALGEEHPLTARSYQTLALSLGTRGRYAEAEGLLLKSLAIQRKRLGEEHPETAAAYNSLAYNHDAQGRYAQAEEGYRKALAIRRKVLGAEHPSIANSYNNLASSLDAQGRIAEAEELHRQALAIRRKVLGEEHPDTATSYNNLAFNLNKQGKYAEAREGFARSLAIRLKAHGAEHPATALGYNNVAFNRAGQGNYAEAEEGFRKALAIRLKVLGAEHPLTASSYNNVASALNNQGRYAEAESQWSRATSSFDKARLRIAASGLDRAANTGEKSPLPALAAILARNGKPEDAWQRFEESLGRGTWDDLSARLRRPPREQAKQIGLVNRLNRLDQLIEKTFSTKGDSDERKKRRDELLTQRRQTQEELDAFAQYLEKTYGPAAGQTYKCHQIQAALPPDTALIGWLDIAGQAKAADPNGEHWVVLLHSSGTPIWVRLHGSGDKNDWIDTDSKLPAELRAALQSPRGAWRPPARRLGEQRLKPLAKHLDGVRRLIVLPSTFLAGVPVEVFADGYTVSYALSGTLYAHLRKQPKLTTQGLLALADPVFDPPTVVDKPLPLPPGGILLTMVAPRSNAALSGLRPNDVLLRYNGTELAGPADLKTLPLSKEVNKPVTVTVWRDGKTFEKQVRLGKLGVVTAGEAAPQALTAQCRLDRRLASATRGGDKWQQLPGTRAEVEALRRLFGEPAPKVLTDSQASEQQLYALATSGELGHYRYLHLATHGQVDDRVPLRSAVILSRDALPDPQKQLDAGRPVYDGQLTALEVLRLWHLHSELVTLSACQTALGKYERGEGFVGFAQSLILSGSRGVCLSLWKVDDAATALLMERFYQNLLGKRAGLSKPLGKSAALAEAKTWLHSLSREEVLKRTARLSNGIARGKGRRVQPLLPAVPSTPTDGAKDRPYAHPYYWAAFVLIGDPE